MEPRIEQHGVIGDRHTSALVASDGSLDWLCIPVYDSPWIFGSLLDAENGGFWRIGPVERIWGHQQYSHQTAVLQTIWDTADYLLELTDFMAIPYDRGSSRILRRLKCIQGSVEWEMSSKFQDCSNLTFHENTGCATGEFNGQTLTLWSTFPFVVSAHETHQRFTLHAHEEMWATLEVGNVVVKQEAGQCEDILKDALAYWKIWDRSINYHGPSKEQVLHSSMMLHLLSYEPSGAIVASPTCSLPERIGGSRNYDYRYAWIRDSSICITSLSRLGEIEPAQRYFDWIISLPAFGHVPLQVVYRVGGDPKLDETEMVTIPGYQQSRPVRMGNRAAQQIQHGSFGFLADSMLAYLESGGKWKGEYGGLLSRIADYISAHWQEEDDGIWEFPAKAHYTSSKVMSWVVLDRAIKIKEMTGFLKNTNQWQDSRDQIHEQVMQYGWSDSLQSFTQIYQRDGLDASALLIPIMGFLPVTHPKVTSTLTQIELQLMEDDFVYRFNTEKSPANEHLPLGMFEGAFLPCTFWMATVYAMLGRIGEAERVVAKVMQIAGETGLLAEEIDIGHQTFLGNFPLLFAHAEYLRTQFALDKVRDAVLGWR